MFRLTKTSYFDQLKALVVHIAFQNPDMSESTAGEDALGSHLLAFAADRARLENRVVNMLDSGKYD